MPSQPVNTWPMIHTAQHTLGRQQSSETRVGCLTGFACILSSLQFIREETKHAGDIGVRHVDVVEVVGTATYVTSLNTNKQS